MTNAEIVSTFVQAINKHDVETMMKWLAKDHTFTDSMGQKLWGSGAMKTAWMKYFEMVPDYEITISEMFEKPDRMALIGAAKGTYARNGKMDHANKWQTHAAWKVVFKNEGTYARNGKMDHANKWQTHAAWKVVFKNERIAEWQVFADNEPIRNIIREQELTIP